jgi:dynein heavy chain
MVDLRKPIMFVGGAGVGKTQLVQGKLGTLPEEIMSLNISFNYFTDVISFQKVRKRHRIRRKSSRVPGQQGGA